MKLGATLYIRSTPEAAEFYQHAFGLTLGYAAPNPDGTYMHAALCRDGQEIFCISESCNDKLADMLRQADIHVNRPIANLGLDFPTQAEVRHAFAMLSQEGTVTLPLQVLPWCSLAAEVVDKYGVYWYICTYE
ncbi:MAG: VOC family protein [Clostridia bacterium]|nr:VOC family protein [Clostridia bacterium]